MLGIFITLAATLAALVLTAVVGVPLAVRLARPKIWGRSQILAMPRAGAAPPTKPSFTPLDLGPDPMRWPSQDPWKKNMTAELPWPSQTWDDPHFGRHWDKTVIGDAADAAYERRQADRRARAEEQRQAEANARIEQPASSSTAQRARQEMRQIRERAARMKAEVQGQAEQKARQVRKAAPQIADAVSNVPPPAELERLVASVGLAGTVQEIMKRTGWDFKTAAQYLAKARRGR